MVESRPGTRSADEHPGGEGARRKVWRGHVERGLETFRAVGGVHQSKARAAVAFGNAAVRAVAIRRRACLFEGDRVSCGPPSERRWAGDEGRKAAEAGP